MTKDPPAPLEPIYTLADAAGILRMTNRGVAKIAKRHGLCMVNGRHITFTAGDIERIKDVMRAEAQGPLPKPAVALSDYQTRKSLERLTTNKKSASPKARAIALARSKRPSLRKLREQEEGGAHYKGYSDARRPDKRRD